MAVFLVLVIVSESAVEAGLPLNVETELNSFPIPAMHLLFAK